MSPDRWQTIDKLYHEALAQEPGLRAQYLADACGTDRSLHRIVQELLSQDPDGTPILDHPLWKQDSESVALAFSGQQFGAYRIVSQIGAGGMGAVFLAEDARLDRKVAIKVSRKRYDQRFEREARAVAALNHPCICALYDVGPNYMVMELLEGETLAARISRGKLTVDEILRYSQQIADALDEAHSKGIVHRDLKPANIMLTRTGLKVLDFGLARIAEVPGQTFTDTNVVMGTPAYMAPEQREGKETGPWTDIYSLAMMMHEMATGSRYPREHAVLAAALPPLVVQIVERCLDPDPSRRWQSARDVKSALELAATAPTPVEPLRPSARRRWGTASAAVAVALVALLAGYWLRPQSADKSFRFSMLPPEGTSFVDIAQGGPPALSPDGQRIAFVAENGGGRLLWVRSLDGYSSRPLVGTEGAANPFWSADGLGIGFFAPGNLKKVDPDGGQVQVVAGNIKVNSNGTWSRQGQILYYPNLISAGNILMVVNASGDQPVQATSRNNELLDENHYYPSFLPDGKHYLLEVRGGPELDLNLWLGTLGTNDRRLLIKGVSNAHYAPPRSGKPGYIVFVRNGKLVAQPFDASTGVLSGETVTVAENVATSSLGNRLADFALSPAGVLAYRSAEPAAHEMVWYDRSGKVVGTIGNRPGNPRNNIRISPDGNAVAFTRQAAETQEVWVHDLVRGVSSRLTLNGGRSPVWSPDGTQIAFVRGDTIYRIAATGGVEIVVWRGPHLISLNDWSGDGKYLLLTRWDDHGVRQVWLLPQSAGGLAGEPVLIANGIHPGFVPAAGPARYVSFDRDQVYLQGLTGEAPGPLQISTDFGNGTRIRRDGREMYFNAGRSLMAVDIDLGPPFHAGAPHELFLETRAIGAGQGQYAEGYDVTSGGQKFLATFAAPETPAASITIVVNWQAGLSK